MDKLFLFGCPITDILACNLAYGFGNLIYFLVSVLFFLVCFIIDIVTTSRFSFSSTSLEGMLVRHDQLTELTAGKFFQYVLSKVFAYIVLLKIWVSFPINTFLCAGSRAGYYVWFFSVDLLPKFFRLLPGKFSWICWNGSYLNFTGGILEFFKLINQGISGCFAFVGSKLSSKWCVYSSNRATFSFNHAILGLEGNHWSCVRFMSIGCALVAILGLSFVVRKQLVWVVETAYSHDKDKAV